MPDSACKECSECGIKFSLIVRRHHCRVCGRIFCSTCSTPAIPGHLLGLDVYGNMRACRECVESFQAHRKSLRATEVGASRQLQQQSLLQQRQQKLSDAKAVESPSHSQDSQSSEVSLDPQTAAGGGGGAGGKGPITVTTPRLSVSSNTSLPPHMTWDEGSSEDSEEDVLSTKQRSNVEFDNPAFLRMLSVGAHTSLNFVTTETEERLLALDEVSVSVCVMGVGVAGVWGGGVKGSRR